MINPFKVEVSIDAKGEGDYYCLSEAIINEIKKTVVSVRTTVSVTKTSVKIQPKGIVSGNDVEVTCTVVEENFNVESIIWKKDGVEVSSVFFIVEISNYTLLTKTTTVQNGVALSYH